MIGAKKTVATKFTISNNYVPMQSKLYCGWHSHYKQISIKRMIELVGPLALRVCCFCACVYCNCAMYCCTLNPVQLPGADAHHAATVQDGASWESRGVGTGRFPVRPFHMGVITTDRCVGGWVTTYYVILSVQEQGLLFQMPISFTMEKGVVWGETKYLFLLRFYFPTSCQQGLLEPQTPVGVISGDISVLRV